ncbi:serine/threonine-protein kinase MRCK beta-like [Ornithodoros turicata]|uniref:serine/threonine-protein kinase MRCK beta-like n=1 Tax=Ornithodoros turicata TaxID=34597 RepID=UPI0031394ADE
MTESSHDSKKHSANLSAQEQKKKSSAKVLTTLFPRIPKVTTVLLEFFMKRESKVSLMRDPLSHFCQEQVVLAAQECHQKLNRQVITYQDIRDMIENLIGLHSLCLKKAPATAKELGATIRKLAIIVGELATSLEKICEVSVTDWMAIGDGVVAKTEHVNMEDIQPYTTFIPKMKDFKPLKLLGAGGFGAVYKAQYVPAKFTCTVKLVAIDRFSRHKQACIDKVVASVIHSPFLVKYYCCFCAKDSYVTMMELVAGVDVMRVVTKANYLPIDQVQIIMAQLILALEHLHLRGFLHRDIKVSNMLIVPGGRVKVIDFDTNKVCLGHFSKRLVKGYFARTAFEFHDGESAGTIPYMAPEILKRRPYGRACDWWSTGIVFYKLMTGRVPFRGKNKQLLRDRIIGAPLKWPRAEEHPHSATSESKDYVFKLLRKNPIERLGSRHYQDLKGHPFFSGFDWKILSSKPFLCDIPAIVEVMGGGPATDEVGKTMKESAKRQRSLTKQGSRSDKGTTDKGRADKGGDKSRQKETEVHLSAGATSGTKKRKLQKIEDMVDMEPELQKPLYTYASASFRKLVLTLKNKKPVEMDDNFMNTSGVDSSELDYRRVSTADSILGGGGAMSVLSDSQTARSSEKLDVILFRRKSMGKFWGFGVGLERVEGEGGRHFYMVESVKRGSPAQRSQLLQGDIVVAVNGTSTSKLPLSQVRKLLNSSGDQVIITVLSSSVYRLLNTRRDIQDIIASCRHETMTLMAVRGGCLGTGTSFGFETCEVKTYNDQQKSHIRYHLVKKVSQLSVTATGKYIYVGDIVMQLDGQPVDHLTQATLKAALSRYGSELKITVAAISPLRQKRHSYTRMHETVMSDTNLETPSSNAFLEDNKTGVTGVTGRTIA